MSSKSEYCKALDAALESMLPIAENLSSSNVAEMLRRYVARGCKHVANAVSLLRDSGWATQLRLAEGYYRQAAWLLSEHMLIALPNDLQIAGRLAVMANLSSPFGQYGTLICCAEHGAFDGFVYWDSNGVHDAPQA